MCCALSSTWTPATWPPATRAANCQGAVLHAVVPARFTCRRPRSVAPRCGTAPDAMRSRPAVRRAPSHALRGPHENDRFHLRDPH